MNSMTRTGLHPAILFAGGIHDFRPTPKPVEQRNSRCEDCGSSEAHAHAREVWDEAQQRWQMRMGCCGAGRDEVGCKPRRVS